MSKRILFIFAAIVLGAVAIFFRASSAHSARTQADQIVKDDAAGADTSASIASLKNFVSLHMGASVNFTLQSSYDRANTAAQASAASAGTTSQVYADAQKACSGKSDSITQAKCNQNYLAAHLSPSPTPTPQALPKLADYQYQLTAPLWTPDLAGALFLGTAAALIFGFMMGRPKGRR